MSEDVAMFQAFNILRYEIGQLYNSHYDAFDPAEYGPQKSQRVQAKSLGVCLVIIGFLFIELQKREFG